MKVQRIMSPCSDFDRKFTFFGHVATVLNHLNFAPGVIKS